MANMRRILICLGAAALLAGCGGQGAQAGGSAGGAGGSSAAGPEAGLLPGNGGQAAAGEAAGDGGSGEAAENGGSVGTSESGGFGTAAGNGGSGEAAGNGGSGTAAENVGDYGDLSAELARLEALPLSGDYGFDSWAGDMETALYSAIRAGLSQGRGLEEILADRVSVTARMTPWTDCGQPGAGGGLAAGGYRAAVLELKKAGIGTARRFGCLESGDGQVWRLDVRGGDNFSLACVQGEDGEGCDLYLLAAGPSGDGTRTELWLWSLDGAADGRVACSQVLAQRLPGKRDQEMQVRPTENGFAVSGTMLEGSAERGLKLDVELGGGQIRVKRSADLWEAQTEGASDYGLLLGLAGDEELRTLWVTAENGSVTCRELPDVILRWTKDGMKTVRYLHYRDQTRTAKGGEASAASGTGDDWKLLAADLPGDQAAAAHTEEKEAAAAYVEENYGRFQGQGNGLRVRERLEFVGDTCLSATALVSCPGGDSGGWSQVHTFLSPLEIALQNGAHLALKDLSETRSSTRNALERELEHYENVYEKAAGQVTGSMGAEWENLPEDGPYLTRRDGEAVAALPVARLRERPDGGMDQTLEEPLVLDVKLTDSLTGYDKLFRKFDRIQYYIPRAEDAVSAPGGSLLAVLTGSEVQLFVEPGEQEALLEPQLLIPTAEGERIVSAVWVKAVDRGTVEAALEAAPDSPLYVGVFGNDSGSGH